MKKLLLFVAILLMTGFNMIAQQGGYALKFDGANDYVNCGNDASLQISGKAITMEAWIFPKSFATNLWENSIIEKTWASGWPDTYGYVLRCGGSGILDVAFGNSTQGWFALSSDANALIINRWQHVAATYDGTNIKLYVNGKLVKSVAETKSISATSNSFLAIGNNQHANTSDRRPFDGYLDEIRIWNIARTEAQIKTNMFKEIGTHTNLKAYYQMSNGTGTSLTDNSGNANTGTLTNGPEWKLSGCFAGSRQALDFDGNTGRDYINCENILNPSEQEALTVEAWVNLTNTSSFRHIIRQRQFYSSGDDEAIGWLFFNSGSYKFRTDLSGTNLASNTSVVPGEWNHLAVVWDGSSISFYLNGVLDVTYDDIYSLASSERDLLLGWGGYWTNTYFLGQLDEVRIWTIDRSESEIRDNMFKTLIGDEYGLEAYYRFDQTDGTILYDMSGNGNNGTLIDNYSNGINAEWVSSSAFNTWLGGESNEWDNVDNWSNGVPTASQSIGLYKWNLDNITTYNATISGNPAMNNLLISSGSSPVLSSGLTVNGNLLLEKDMSLNGQTVTLGPLGYLVEGNGYFSGTTGMITTTRTLNNIFAQNVAGLGAILTSTADFGSTTLTRTHSSQDNVPFGSSVLRTYEITPTNNTGLNATLVYQYNQNELNNLVESELALFSSAEGASIFIYRGGVLDADNNQITLTNINGFSSWTAGKDCHNPFIGGEIGTDQAICYNTAPAAFTSIELPSEFEGNLEYQWQLSTVSPTASFDDWSNVGTNTITYNHVGTMTQTTWFRRLVMVTCDLAGWASATASNVVEVTVRAQFTPGAIETTGETICYNTAASEIGSVTPAGGGDENITYSWRSSADGYATYILGADASAYTPGTLTQTTTFRRYAKDGECNTDPEQSTGEWTVTVYDEFTPGAIETTGETICYNTAASEIGSVTLAGGGDESFTYSWRSSADSYAADIPGADASAYTPGALTQTTTFRRYAKDGECNTDPEQSTGEWTVTVYDEFTPGAIETTGETICYNTAASEIGSVTPAGGGDENITYSWRSSADGYATYILGADASAYTPGTLTQTTTFRRYAKDGECNTDPEQSTGEWTVTVYDEFTPGAIETTGETICYNTAASEIGSVTLAGGGDESFTYSWRSSADSYAADIPGADASAYTPGALTQTTTFRRYAKDGTCNTDTEQSTGEWTVTIEPYVTPDVTIALTAGNNPCCPGDVVTFEATPVNGGPNPSYQWYVNGLPAGTDTPVFNYDPDNGDEISVQMTTSVLCPTAANATSNTITMEEINPSTVLVSMRAAKGTGREVVFTAYPINGGDNPVYKWYKNNVLVQQGSSPVLTSECTAGDEHYVELYSSLPCGVKATSLVYCSY